MLQNAQSMQSLHNINLDNYGYGMTGGMNGGNTFQDMMVPQRGMPHSMHMGEQGLSPPYSNQSPPHSVQSNLALSPQGYIGEWQKMGKKLEKLIKMCLFVHFRISLPSKSEAKSSYISDAHPGHATCDATKTWCANDDAAVGNATAD